MLLTQYGVPTTYEASNIDEAREQLATHQPEMVTLDLNMPGGNGLDFLREIRTHDEDTYVIVMSADALATTVRAAVEAGADGFIRKDLPLPKMIEGLNDIFADDPPGDGVSAS